ncbi:MAG: energy transducer TonB [Candidatus Delongbacteria bacterium]
MAYKVGQFGERESRLEEIMTLIVFLVLTFVFAAFHKFETEVTFDDVVSDEIEIEQVEVTEQVKKTSRPATVRIPIAVEDEEELEEDIEMEIETASFDIKSEAPPPPPPPQDSEEEIFDFFAIQEKPEMMKGYAAKMQQYILKNYPSLAKRSGVSGSVIVRFVCSTEGIPEDISIVQEKPKDMGFGEVAVKAIEQARFKPGMQRDKPVPVRMSQRISFNTSMR